MVGLPGAGKTTWGRRLASELKYIFVDLDHEIEKMHGRPIKEIFRSEGETHFRTLEKECLLKSINDKDSFIMATGGGTPCFFDNMHRMNDNGFTIYLKVSPKVSEERLKTDVSRPLLYTGSIKILYESRKVCYEKANIHVSNYHELVKLWVNRSG